LREARAQGLSVYGETRPIYLFFTRAQYRLPDNEGAKFVGNPPLRDETDVEALWTALGTGELSMVCSDHVGRLVASKKDPVHTFATIPPGMPNLETLIPMLYSEGVRKGRIPLPRMVEIVSTNPARLAGLEPRKGAIRIGADADLVIFNPHLTRTIRATEMKSASDFDPFEGWQVTGWPTMTLSRGEVVYKNGEILGKLGRGRFVPRARFRRL
jgi:dihydropyrimidinase